MASCACQVWCLNKAWCPNQAFCLHQNIVLIPDAGDLVIEILTDQMMDFDESWTDALEIFAVTGGDKKRAEVNERKMTDEDRKLFCKAKGAELQSWMGDKVFVVVKERFADTGRVMRARSVLTWKSIGTAKGRLCLLGFQDPDSTEVRDSPTLSAQAEALILQFVASDNCKLVSGDIKTACLSGDTGHRNIFTLPPDGARDILKLSPKSTLRLRKAAYGLVNAPKKWCDRLKRSLLHGFTPCALDPCVFVFTKHNEVRGVTRVHMDFWSGERDEVFD